MPLSLQPESTVGVIARQMGEPIHRIEYIIRTRNIRPTRIVGRYRVFDEAAVNLIVAELRRIDQRKGDVQ
jgi:hypothetical protein